MWPVAFRIFFVAALAVGAARGHDSNCIEFGGRRFDPRTPAELAALDAAARAALATNPPGKVTRALATLRAFISAHETAHSNQREQIEFNMAEVAMALQNNDRTPVPRTVDVLQLPFVHYRYISGRVGLGSTTAANLPRSASDADTSLLDPLPSTFWKRPTNIRAQNLAVGFGRGERPRFEDPVWEYAAPKRSYGANAGFKARHGGITIKIKFGETRSEPFAARIFHALGYHVEPTDYSPGLKVRYNHRLFSEFNSRKPLDTRITLFGIVPVGMIHFQPQHDADAFIARAVMKDGTSIEPEALRTRVAEGRDAEVDYLVTVAANVQVESDEEQSIGPWDFGQLDHAARRELRGAGLLAAWLGWFDSRFDNTRLVVSATNALHLRHVFADLGGGLGKSTGLAGWRGELPDAFSDRFTRPEIRQGRGRMTLPFKVVNHRPIEPTAAFREMTIDDARWMARLIAQLTEGQIVDALRASGFTDANVEIYQRKLLNRRTQLLEDLGLTE
jgi:hypothetical protein